MNQRKSIENFLFSVGGVIAMFLLLAGIYIISHLAAARVDLTEEKMFTLSQGTKAILKKLDTPVQIRFYATQGKDMPVELKTYAQRVEDLLREYQKYGGKNIQVKKYDPQPDSDAEDSANLDGVEGQQINLGDKIYLGLAVSMLDQKVALPFLDPRRERLLEYDVTRAVANVMNTEKAVVGVMSSLPVFGQMNPMMMRMGGGRQESWLLIDELKRDFNVKEIQPTADKIDDDVKILLVIHPKNFSDKALYAIDQFVMRGGKLMAFVDPMSVVDSQNSPQQQNPLQGAMNAGSSLDKLTKAWGIEFDGSKVVADLVFATKINRGNQTEDNPAVLSLTDQSVNTNDVVTSQIDSLLLPFVGAFSGTPAEGLKQTVLMHSSSQSQLVEKFMAEFGSQNITKDFQPSGKEFALAVRLAGKFKSAFPDGAPADGSTNQPAATSEHLKESKETAVILVGDSDMLYDRFAAQVQNFFGQKMVFPMNGNLNFVQNAVEQNAGDENLIAVRSRATMNRPFTKVREMEAAAQERYRTKIRDLEKSLQDTQTRLNELQQAKQGNGQQKFILSPEQQAELQKFKEKQAEVNKELKSVRKDLRRDIDSLENRLKWLNIAGMPILVTFVGVSLAIVKRKRTAAR